MLLDYNCFNTLYTFKNVRICIHMPNSIDQTSEFSTNLSSGGLLLFLSISAYLKFKCKIVKMSETSDLKEWGRIANKTNIW